MNELERLGGSLGGAAVGRRLQRGASGLTAGRTASGEMGHDTKGSMKRGIVGSTVAIVLMSPDYANSNNCNFELDAILNFKKSFIICM